SAGSKKRYALDAQYYCQLTPKAVRGIEILAGLLYPGIWAAPGSHEAAEWSAQGDDAPHRASAHG
ncbi:MAG: hypothetical protein K2Y05_04180, partial [Hyphomicrobiaceae bacterium]|nr:hypothetical protein [Hyphomicrobiaceae bacterium]